MKPSKKKLVLAVSLAVIITTGLGGIFWWRSSASPSSGESSAPAAPSSGYAGSGNCRECHEKFYKLWAPSHHGLALQPVPPELLKTGIEPQKTAITIGEHRYRAVFREGKGVVLEQGPEGGKTYPMAYAMGGKDVYYFLAPLEKGRLQVLPVAYDVRKKEWFDTTTSMIRHFTQGARTQPMSWRDPRLTFNTACYACHVSQLTTNYDLKTDTYHTVWAEPGINCETCHGPAAEHIRVCREAPKGTIPKDLKIFQRKGIPAAQNNAACGSCHAKMIPVTTSFRPGERYFDNFDLIALEDRDFYPDGRDLGENFTLTLWRLSPCAQSGQLACIHCHTPSGRYLFKDEAKANQACLPCHRELVENAAGHSHHRPGVPSDCISCHMPTTEFARMRRTDHSMLSPTPGGTKKFNSPNACNLCHTDKDAKWSDWWVRNWYKRDYQAPLLKRAELIKAARQRNWARLPGMLQYLTSPGRDEIYATALIRLLAFCPDSRKWPAIQQALKDRSPLVRGAAAAALEAHLTPETAAALLACLDDSYRLVRIRAAGALAAYPRELLSAADQDRLEKATQELETSLTARPDDWSSYYNLGNYYLSRQELSKARDAFNTASRLRPEAVLPWVNVSLVYARLGRMDHAETALRRALALAPDNATANFNLALLLAEQGKRAEAETHLRLALQGEPQFPEASYNLGVLLVQGRLSEALQWLRRAHELRPREQKYSFSLAYYLTQQGDLQRAIKILKRQVQQKGTSPDTYLLLGKLYEQTGRPGAAKRIYQQALADEGLPSGVKQRFETKLQGLLSMERRQKH